MFLTLLKKEFVERVLDLRSLASNVLCGLLVILALMVGAGEYLDARDASAVNKTLHKKDAAMKRNYLSFICTGAKVEMPPSNLRVLALGLERDPDKTLRIRPYRVPRVCRDSRINPLAQLFPVADLVLVVGTLLSILAFVSSHDTICGERERGTMPLLMSYSVPRDKLLMAKFCGAYASLAIPFVLASGVGGIVLLAFDIGFAPADWLASGLVVLLSLVLLAVCISVGLFVSCVCRSSAVSMSVLILVWLVFVALIPNVSPYVAELMVRAKPFSVYASKVAQAGSNAQIESRKTVLIPNWDRLTKAVETGEMTEEEAREKYHELEFERQTSLLETTYHVEHDKLHDYVREQSRQLDVAMKVSRASPVAAYVYGATSIAGTGLNQQDAFSEALERYQRSFKRYVAQKRSEAVDAGDETAWGWELNPNYDVSDMPVLSYQEEVLSARLKSALGDITLLGSYALVFFLAAFVVFVRQAVV